ncbi:MAG: hypothetical protein ABIT01_04670, partial [Thermoanaerobaculia bacterium]
MKKSVSLAVVLSLLSIATAVPTFAAQREKKPREASKVDARADSDVEDEVEGDNDPDLPPGMAGKIDKGEYLRKRAEYINEKRGNPGSLSYDARGRAIQEMDNQIRQRNKIKSLGGGPAWALLGPHPIPNGQTSNTSVPVSGRTISIAIHPTNSNILYVGTAGGGIYKSTNGGDNWTPLFELQLGTLAIGAITIDPSDSNVVWIGTGEAGFSGDSLVGVGVYKISAANSATPTISGPFNQTAGAVDIFSGRGIGRIAVSSDGSTIFVCTTSAISGNPAVGPFNIPTRGIYRSTNANTATPIFAQLTGLVAGASRNVVDLVLDPGDSNLLIATVVGAAADGGIYRSTDALAVAPTFTRTRVLPDGATN